MGTYGAEFLSVAEILGELAIRPSTQGSLRDSMDMGWVNFRDRLVQYLANAPGFQRLANGGYLYFPPGEYYLPSGISIPSNVTLVIAPGAMIYLKIVEPAEMSIYRTFCIEVQGGIQAGLQPFVQPTFAGNDSFSGDDPVFNRSATVVFSGDQVREVYPEWWGARTESYPFGGTRSRVDSSPALQSAVDAAVHWREGAFGASIPIILSGKYFLKRPVYIGRRPWVDHAIPGAPPQIAEMNPFILRGRSSPALRGVASLSVHPGPVLPASNGGSAWAEKRSLLIVRGPSGFLIEDILFDGFADIGAGTISRPDPVTGQTDHPEVSVPVEVAFCCLRLEAYGGTHFDEHGDAVLGPDAQMSRVRRCGFRGAAGALVQVGEFMHPYGEPLGAPQRPSPDPTGGQDLLGLVFDGCKFQRVCLSC